MNNRITDLSFFDQNSFGDPVLYRELLAIFARTTPVMVSQMQSAISADDYEQLSKVAHKLKSNVQAVGLDKVYALLDEIENSNLSKMEPKNLDKMLDIVYSTCATAVAEVEGELMQSK